MKYNLIRKSQWRKVRKIVDVSFHRCTVLGRTDNVYYIVTNGRKFYDFEMKCWFFSTSSVKTVDWLRSVNGKVYLNFRLLAMIFKCWVRDSSVSCLSKSSVLATITKPSSCWVIFLTVSYSWYGSTNTFLSPYVEGRNSYLQRQLLCRCWVIVFVSYSINGI